MFLDRCYSARKGIWPEKYCFHFFKLSELLQVSQKQTIGILGAHSYTMEAFLSPNQQRQSTKKLIKII